MIFFSEYVQVYFESPDKMVNSSLVSLIYQTSRDLFSVLYKCSLTLLGSHIVKLK